MTSTLFTFAMGISAVSAARSVDYITPDDKSPAHGQRVRSRRSCLTNCVRVACCAQSRHRTANTTYSHPTPHTPQVNGFSLLSRDKVPYGPAATDLAYGMGSAEQVMSKLFFPA